MCCRNAPYAINCAALFNDSQWFEFPIVGNLLSEIPTGFFANLLGLEVDVEAIAALLPLLMPLLEAEVVGAPEVIGGGAVDRLNVSIGDLEMPNLDVLATGRGEFELLAEGLLDCFDLLGDRLTDDRLAGEISIAASRQPTAQCNDPEHDHQALPPNPKQ